jgi:succinoglycan biosynthesis protein ExoM
MLTQPPHISVCICTYKRPDLLDSLLSQLAAQQTDDLFAFSATVVDNDAAQSARSVVDRHKRSATLPLSYHVEPKQSIALARNRAVENATGDFIAFIDDDEVPAKDWLASLYRAWLQYNSDGILGPVLPYFETEPPAWIVRGKFYERDTHPTGTVLPWRSTRTGNALLRADLFRHNTPAFSPLLGSGGEDREFFKRMIEKGHTFVWCNEAEVFEMVPPRRWSRSFMLRRALHRGQNYRTNAARTWATVPMSLAAIVLYGTALPFTLVAGEHVFMDYLIKLCDHLGKCLAFVGITPIKDTYVTN